jgi:glycosyltransferase involved in cell wall biosynthesis
VAEPHDVEGLAQAILRLLRDESERSEIAEAGYRHIQQFSWDRAARRLEAALEQGIRQR